MKIAVIEDETPVRQFLSAALTTLYPGVTVLEFTDIPSGCCPDTAGVDLIISDCNLPSGNICECMCFQQHNIPVILITGDPTMKCKTMNCIALYKPFTIQELKNAIDSLISG